MQFCTLKEHIYLADRVCRSVCLLFGWSDAFGPHYQMGDHYAFVVHRLTVSAQKVCMMRVTHTRARMHACLCTRVHHIQPRKATISAAIPSGQACRKATLTSPLHPSLA